MFSNMPISRCIARRKLAQARSASLSRATTHRRASAAPYSLIWKRQYKQTSCFLFINRFSIFARIASPASKPWLRWRHPARGLVSPLEFIALVEESGLIHPIGDWVVRHACQALAQWPANIRVAVNVSAVQFQNANILQIFVRALADSRVAPGRLEIEITESILLSKYDSAASVLNSLLELGVTVALDDFGTGYSSLTYLRRLPFSRIKIDQSFVRDMLVQPDSAAIVKSVIALARDLKIGVVAEGVESTAQLDYLRQTNCDEIQGYLIGRPVQAKDVIALLGDHEQNGVTQSACVTKFG